MAYGTPAGPDDIDGYYTHVRRGRPPSPELLDDLVRRYAAIGGASPLAARTRAQAGGVAAALERQAPGRYRVAVGYKHAPPFLEDAVDQLLAEGTRQLIGLVLAPHFSRGSVGEYLGRLRARAAALDPTVEVAAVDDWHLEPAYLDFLTAEVRRGLAGLPTGSKVLFTAHSLPRRIVEDDPYVAQVGETAAAVASAAGLAPWTGWAVAWQSAGRTPEPWIGPDVGDVLAGLAGAGGGGVLVCPCGFVSDHLEVLFDLDLEAAGRAAELGLAFSRTAVPNDDPTVLGALAERVVALGAVAA